MKNKSALFQKWLPFKTITENGLVVLKDNTHVKIIRVFPINYNLKSELENVDMFCYITLQTPQILQCSPLL